MAEISVVMGRFCGAELGKILRLEFEDTWTCWLFGKLAEIKSGFCNQKYSQFKETVVGLESLEELEILSLERESEILSLEKELEIVSLGK